MTFNYINLIKNISKKLYENKITKTPLVYNSYLSNKFLCNVYLKREDLQITRSFKIRGAFNKISTVPSNKLSNGIVCASAGNHAQGFAYCCSLLNIKGYIFVPTNTPTQKLDKISYYSNGSCEIIQYGLNFDETLNKSLLYCNEHEKTYIHPYNDIDVINGQATITDEILSELPNTDYIISTIGGGGLISGTSLYCVDYCKNKSIVDDIKIIGVEPENADSMKKSIEYNKLIKLKNIDTFVDGASVSLVGDHTFNICKKSNIEYYTVSNGKLSEELIRLYQSDGIIAEPAGALSVAVLDKLNIDKIKNKNIVCIVSGGNNDLLRYPDYYHKKMIYKNLHHFYVINFSQKEGQLKNFVQNVLGPTDDIIKFSYIKKNNNNYGPVFIGLQLAHVSDINNINDNLIKYNYNFQKISPDDKLYDLLM